MANSQVQSVTVLLPVAGSSIGLDSVLIEAPTKGIPSPLSDRCPWLTDTDLTRFCTEKLSLSIRGTQTSHTGHSSFMQISWQNSGMEESVIVIGRSLSGYWGMGKRAACWHWLNDHLILSSLTNRHSRGHYLTSGANLHIGRPALRLIVK